MLTTMTVKGQVTVPKSVRDDLGLKPGDKLEIRSTAAGTAVLRKPGSEDDYKKRLYALAKRRIIRGITTEELMEMTRGYSEDLPRKKK